MSHIRIEETGMIAGTNTRVFYVGPDDVETEISSCVRGITFNLKLGEPNTATLECVRVVGHVMGELVDVVVEDLKPRKRFRRKLRDVTGFGHLTRVYIR